MDREEAAQGRTEEVEVEARKMEEAIGGCGDGEAGNGGMEAGSKEVAGGGGEARKRKREAEEGTSKVGSGAVAADVAEAEAEAESEVINRRRRRDEGARSPPCSSNLVWFGFSLSFYVSAGLGLELGYRKRERVR